MGHPRYTALGLVRKGVSAAPLAPLQIGNAASAKWLRSPALAAWRYIRTSEREGRC